MSIDADLKPQHEATKPIHPDKPPHGDDREHPRREAMAKTLKGFLENGKNAYRKALKHLADRQGGDQDSASQTEPRQHRGNDERRAFDRLSRWSGRRGRTSMEEATDAHAEAVGHSTVSLIDTGYTDEQLSALRDPEKVGAGEGLYGDSLVNTFHHKDVITPDGHELAQEAAYRGLQEKIDKGLIDPTAMTQEMCKKLGVSMELGEVPAKYDDIASRVNAEVRTFIEGQHLSEAEATAIEKAIVEFTELYGKAYGKENVTKAYELVRDNARKLVYQTAVDKDVFSGSDHGITHIYKGNINFAMQMVKSLREHGVNVSEKDQLLMYQIMIDHDLGYTTGAGQAPGGFFASKDHPLVSTKFIEENKAYYVDKFGEDGYNVIKDSVLNHSYPRLEYQSDNNPDAIHASLIRGVTSTVDSAGATVETKTPIFFRNAKAMEVLLMWHLAAEVNGGKVPADLQDKYHNMLVDIANDEPNPVTKAGFLNALDKFFKLSPDITRATTIGQYAGVIDNITVDFAPQETQSDITQGHEHDGHGEDDHGELSHKRLRVVVEMQPTRAYALLADIFGGKDANQSYVKVMKDLGLDTGELQAYGRKIATAKRKGGEAPQKFVSEHGQAKVIVGNTLLEDLPEGSHPAIEGFDDIKAISKVFEKVYLLSMRSDINQALDMLEGKKPSEIPAIVDDIRDFFAGSLRADRINSAELTQLDGFLNDLSVPAKAADAKTALKRFLTGREKEFLGISTT